MPLPIVTKAFSAATAASLSGNASGAAVLLTPRSEAGQHLCTVDDSHPRLLYLDVIQRKLKIIVHDRADPIDSVYCHPDQKKSIILREVTRHSAGSF